MNLFRVKPIMLEVPQTTAKFKVISVQIVLIASFEKRNRRSLDTAVLVRDAGKGRVFLLLWDGGVCLACYLMSAYPLFPTLSTWNVERLRLRRLLGEKAQTLAALVRFPARLTLLWTVVGLVELVWATVLARTRNVLRVQLLKALIDALAPVLNLAPQVAMIGPRGLFLGRRLVISSVAFGRCMFLVVLVFVSLTNLLEVMLRDRHSGRLTVSRPKPCAMTEGFRLKLGPSMVRMFLVPPTPASRVATLVLPGLQALLVMTLTLRLFVMVPYRVRTDVLKLLAFETTLTPARLCPRTLLKTPR